MLRHRHIFLAESARAMGRPVHIDGANPLWGRQP